MRLIDLTGRTFGRLEVKELVKGGAVTTIRGSRSTAPLWYCRCACGQYTKVRSDCLRKGVTRSCGCLRREGAFQAQKVRMKKSHPLFPKIKKYRMMGLTWDEIGKLMDLKHDRAFKIARQEARKGFSSWPL